MSDIIYKLSELLNKLNISYKQIGKKKDDTFNLIRTPLDADEHSLIFVNKPDDGTLKMLSDCSCSVVILEKNWAAEHLNEITDIEKSIFIVEKPRSVVTQIMNTIYPDNDHGYKGIHPTVIIHPAAEIHSSVSIGPHCIIGNCEIGENSQIHSFTVIKDNTKVGKNVIIREHCLIGGCGFGYVRHNDGHLERMPHIGLVTVEDDVELFPYVNVDRGAIGETRVKRGTKIDHYSHIGHNCIIGEHCIITAGTVFCGGSKIGKQSWVGVGSILKEKVSVGDNVTIGLGSVVIKNFGNNTVIAGVPAKQLKEKES